MDWQFFTIENMADWKSVLKPLTASEVHILTFQPERCRNLKFSLNTEEQRQASTMVEHRRMAFSASRHFLREILSFHSGISSQDISFTYGPHGKPLWSEVPSLHFNLSHSGEWAALAITKIGPVGIDIEKIKPIKNRAKIAERIFTISEQEWLKKSGLLQEFFRLWVAKEAFVKALGQGMFSGPQHVHFKMSTDGALSIDRIDGQKDKQWTWTLKEFSPAPGYAGSCSVISEMN